MKLAVVVPTAGRKELVREVVARLAFQTRLPDEVIVSAPDASHVETIPNPSIRVAHVFGPMGITAQRNRGLDYVRGSFDVVTFFDDDFLPADNYLETVERLLLQHPNWTVLTGSVVLDGVNNGGYSVAEGIAALARLEATGEVRVAEPVGAHGCNMSMRTNDVAEHRFDERLPLYGWQEDTDFSRRVAESGKIVRTSELIGVHLGEKTGRLSGLRLGYSQIVNPVYLVRKRTMPLWYAAQLMARNLLANAAGSLGSEPHVDRRGRLKGNVLGICDVVRGRVEPERILAL